MWPNPSEMKMAPPECGNCSLPTGGKSLVALSTRARSSASRRLPSSSQSRLSPRFDKASAGSPRTNFVLRDASSRHVGLADQAISLGPIEQDGGNPYLNAGKLVRICLEAGADAIHPGYGYLSENADFADQVSKAGITFVGPSAAAMSTLGDKRTAKAYLRENDPQIPLIPGFTGSSQESEELEKAATEIGFPIMLKASAGGGGKGMRVVHHKKDLEEELRSAQSEAVRSFGSSDCILEKYIEAGKHVEIQIIGDSHGNVISLHERECSVQRRHQKGHRREPFSLDHRREGARR